MEEEEGTEDHRKKQTPEDIISTGSNGSWVLDRLSERELYQKMVSGCYH